MPSESPAPELHLLQGSERKPVPDPEQTRPCDANESIRITVHVRRRDAESLDELVHQMHKRDAPRTRHLTTAQFHRRFGADPAHLEAIEVFANHHGLKVEETDSRRSIVVLSGTAAKMAAAFHVTLKHYQTSGRTFRIREGGIYIPKSLKDVVTGIFGFDNRPAAKPHFRALGPKKRLAASGTTRSYDPTQVATLYQFPPNTSGKGETIGIIELGGGYSDQDLNTYFSNLGIAPVPQISAVSVAGGQNTPSGDPNSADGEVALDIEIAGAVAPSATQKVFFAPNTNQGFLDAIGTAVHDPDVSLISISWGQAEPGWTAQALNSFDQAFQSAAVMGKTVFAAAGDNGSSDGVNDGNNHVDFPASSPNVVACGGTTLTAAPDNSSITSETVWNEQAQGLGATGGGVSDNFPLPDYQKNANVPPPANPKGGRGVPDVAGDADPVTGYNVLVDGSSTVSGGTSAVAPLYAGLFARINEALVSAGKPRVGFVNAQLYQNPSAFTDITSGNNGAFSAGPGWDPTTGLGSPDGVQLLAALSQAGGATPAAASRRRPKARKEKPPKGRRKGHK
jgi:kumamolisin